jgi:hypothetical protein
LLNFLSSFISTDCNMAPAKRKAGAATQMASKKAQKTQKKGKSKPKRREFQVPVDETFNECRGAEVYISDDDTIYDASLNQTNVGDNNNKVGSSTYFLNIADEAVLFPPTSEVQGLRQVLHPYSVGQSWRIWPVQDHGSNR